MYLKKHLKLNKKTSYKVFKFSFVSVLTKAKTCEPFKAC